MKIKDESKNGVTIFYLGGKIMGGPDATQFRGKIHEALDGGARKIVIDLKEAERIDSVGIGMLVSALHSIRGREGQMKIAEVPGKIKNLLNIVQLERIMKTHDTLEEALNSF